jgi:hypothetical protein
LLPLELICAASPQFKRNASNSDVLIGDFQ